MTSTRTVRITVRGSLNDRLATAFDGMTPVRRAGATDLVGDLVDQAQLHGLLERIRDLGLELESVETSCMSSRTAGGRRDASLRARAPLPVTTEEE